MTFEEVFSYEHLFDSARECCSGVRWKQSTQMFELDIAIWVTHLQMRLLDGTYKSKGFIEFNIHERGKLRHIQAVHISERCVQKCLCKYYLKPLLVPKLIYDNSASIKGKGTHFALKRLKQHLSWHYKKYGKQGGILLVDYHSYFPSIRHDKLKEMLRHYIEDDRLYELTAMFIDCFEGETGIGLGSEVCQICAIFYTNKIDHYIKERLHIHGYGRYMDDSYLIHQDTDYLKYCLSVIRDMSKELGLELNEKVTRIVRFNDGFEYLKKRVYLTDTGKVLMRLNRDNIKRRRRVMKATAKNGSNVREGHRAWRGTARKFNAYRTILNMDALCEELEAV